MNIKEMLKNLAKLIAIVFAATILGRMFVELIYSGTNIVVVYLLAVLIVARFTSGYLYGIMASVVSLLCYNYFFTEPYHTFQVNDPGNLISLTIMLIAAVLTSAMTTEEKLLTKEANERSKENQILYMLSTKLSDAADMESVLKAAAESISNLLGCNAGCKYVGGQTEEVHVQQVGDKQIHRNVTDSAEYREKFADEAIEYYEDGDAYYYPIYGHEHLLAVVNVDKRVGMEQIVDKKSLLHPIIENVALAMERIEITIGRVRDRENMERERERANLLRAISHDLRTPLSGIIGTSEILMDMTDEDDSRQELLSGIYRDAAWLKSLVENILNLTRLQDGRIVIHKEMEAIEEVIGSAVAHAERSFPYRDIQVETPEDFRLVPMDAKLIEQVITNLLDNAVKHTAPDEAISVSAGYTKDGAVITVCDEGEGIAEADLPHLFNIFYTAGSRSTDVKRGIGLGLTICETVVKAHGGSITAGNRTDRRGAKFVVTLPFAKGEEGNE